MKGKPEVQQSWQCFTPMAEVRDPHTAFLVVQWSYQQKTRKRTIMSQNRLTKADAKNRAGILSTKLNIMHHAYGCLAGCYEQISTAFDGKHITLSQYNEFLIALGAIEDDIQASSLDYERIKALGESAWTLRNRVLTLVDASKNAAAGWYEEYPGGPKKRGAPYVAAHLK
jgi:hypothetical protein